MRNMSYTATEQEHWDHVNGSATEFQNCFTEARAEVQELNNDHSAPIVRARSIGLFVVVREIEYYCRSTDAFAGTFDVFVVAFPTRESADARIAKLYARQSEWSETRYRVVSPL
jgi:hypothetical protein